MSNNEELDLRPGHATRSKQKASKTKKKRTPPDGMMKAIVRGGEGEFPEEGHLVVFHYTVRKADGTVCDSTRSEYGGKGHPRKAMLGKTPQLAVLEFGLQMMRPRELSVLKAKPEHHYGEPKCQVAAPEWAPLDELLLFELELLSSHKDAKELGQDSRILKHVVTDGTGWEQPRAPYQVKIKLQASISGGQPFYTSGEAPIQLPLGEGKIPIGLEAGLESMLRNERAVFHLSQEEDLLPAGVLPTPPGGATEVEVDVELIQIIQVRDVHGDGSIIKTRIRDGQGEFPVDCPLEDSQVVVHYRGTLPDEAGREFYNTRTDPDLKGGPLHFGTGEGLVPVGLDASVRLMVPGEVAKVTAVARHAYDKFLRPEGVPEGARVEWEVELLGFEKPKEWDGMNFEEIMGETNKTKELASQVFKRGHFGLARGKYEKLLRELHNVHPQNDEETDALSKVKVSLQLNMSMCYQKEEEFVKAIEWANKVLDMDPNNAKGLYRRGVARTSCGDFDDARRDFRAMARVDPTAQSDAASWLAKIKKKEQDAESKQRKQFKGLFDKHPGEFSEELDSTTNMATVEKDVPVPDINKETNEKEEGKEEKQLQGTTKSVFSVVGLYKLSYDYMNAIGVRIGQCNIL